MPTHTHGPRGGVATRPAIVSVDDPALPYSQQPAPSLFELDAPQPSHPAKYTDALLLTMAKMLQGRKRILDPFGGTGKVFLLEHWLKGVEIQAIELEKRWAAKHPRTTHGNALYLPWSDNYFDAVNTSPTYGNRMGDTTPDTEKYQRRTYTAMMGSELHPDNTGKLQWGREYCEIHRKTWIEARRVLAPGGVLVLNMKDHIRNGKRMRVTLWHILCLTSLGFRLIEHKRIGTPSYSFGQNGDARVPYESVILFELGAK